MKLSLFMFFVFFFGFETPLKDFQFYSYILLTLRFRYLQTRIKESCIYLSGQIFFKNSAMKLKNSKENPRKMLFICRPRF